ncbi:hypothetical protein P153DRAFT_301968 [Dothidotthia symphoricarpi CBS 119687]|uniref:Uncharacterized protein n=1 Tax=Dothidotthia symphoricarpi CBS 119687 TaxID=1392245 RepID=A0A6A6A0D2_9PLEO|nr:uncharacterized protein P153DRAFT_301968 [Dothidotthia symphoricarpi CBS 119687]KAF2124603.1 hypothetical protein P153DRAFT_301968 [Dothidotthia symphoricarpi CBS 119687]
MNRYVNQSGINTNTMTAFGITVFLHGYSYDTIEISTRLAMAVILSYCIIAIAYTIYTLIAGSTSTAWNSPIELVTLALQSKRSDHLGYTSVRVDSIETLRQNVGIRVNSKEELELVFAHDREIETRELRKIIRNKEY